MTTGERLAKWRLDEGLSQREAAAKAGMSQAAWQSYESGGKPGVEAAVSIDTLTDGKIKVADWRDSKAEREARRSKAASRRVRRTAA